MDKQKIAQTLYESANDNGLVETLHHVFGKNIKVNIPFSKSACLAQVDDVDFSIRANNALKRSGLMTVGAVIDAIADDRLMAIRNLGRKSYNEIKTRILLYGYDRLTEGEKLRFFLDLVEQNNRI